MFGKDYYACRYGRLFFSPDDDGGGGTNGGETKPDEQKPKETPKDPLADLPDDVRKIVQGRIDSAAANARKEGLKAGKTEAETAAAEKAATEKAEKEQADLIAKGEFDSVKSKLESERDAEKAKADRLLKIATADLADRIKAVNDLGDKELSDALAAITEPLDQIEWLNDPRTKRALATASEEKKVADANGKPKVHGTPKPDLNGKSKELSERTAQRYARSYTG